MREPDPVEPAAPPTIDQDAAALSAPDPEVRSAAVRRLRAAGADALPAIPALLAAFGDADDRIAMQARFAVGELAESAVPVLQQIRRAGPGRLRRAALTALADIGGEAALSERDIAAVERLVQVKLPDESPTPLTGCWLHWIAVPGDDQQGIMAVLGLSRPRQATFALGNDIVDADAHSDPDDEDGPYRRVFVTPELDGWTLVVGAWSDPCHPERSEELLEQLAELSERYGKAQAYYYGARNDGSAWLVAENGVILRRYQETGDADDPEWTLGEPLACERARRRELGLPAAWDEAERDDSDDESAQEWKWAAFDLAPRIAAELSVDPLTIGPHTAVRGTPLVALTPEGTGEGVPPGVHRI